MLNFANDLAAALDALRRHAILFLLGVTIVALALLGRSWLDAHDASLRLQATLAAQQKTITDADQRQSTRDAQLTQTLAQITAAKQKVQTPTQAASALTQAIPQLIAGAPGGKTLPAPITIELPSAANTGESSGAVVRNAGPEASRSPDLSGDSQHANRLADASVASDSLPTNSAGAPSTNSNTKSNAATNYPWTALKLELAKLGLGHSTKSSAKGLENQEGSAASQKGNGASSIAQKSASPQTDANVSGNSSAQSTSPAQTNSPPKSAANDQGKLSSTQTNTSPASGAGAQAGPAPAIIRVPQEDLKLLYDAVEDCQICQAKLTAAQGDLSDEKTKFASATAQRDAAIAAARGTFWTRARTAAKWIVIGAAAGAVLARYH